MIKDVKVLIPSSLWISPRAFVTFCVVRKCNQINTSKRGFIGSRFLFLPPPPSSVSLSLLSRSLYLLTPIPTVSLSLYSSLSLFLCLSPDSYPYILHLSVSASLSHLPDTSWLPITSLFYIASFSSFYLQMKCGFLYFLVNIWLEKNAFHSIWPVPPPPPPFSMPLQPE